MTSGVNEELKFFFRHSKTFAAALTGEKISSSASPSGSDVIHSSDDQDSQFFVHPSDNPGSLICSEIFNESNFSIWKGSIERALSAKNKLDLMDLQLFLTSQLILLITEELWQTLWVRRGV